MCIRDRSGAVDRQPARLVASSTEARTNSCAPTGRQFAGRGLFNHDLVVLEDFIAGRAVRVCDHCGGRPEMRRQTASDRPSSGCDRRSRSFNFCCGSVVWFAGCRHVDLGPHPAHAGTNIYSGTLVRRSRCATCYGNRPSCSLEQAKQTLRDKACLLYTSRCV